MGKKVQKKKPQNLQDLQKIIENIWYDDINEEYLNKLYESMPRRIEAIIKVKGGSTKY